VKDHFDNITQRASKSMFAETYTEKVGSSLNMVDTLAGQLDKASVTTSFPSSGLGNQLKMVSRLTKVAKAQGTERAAFMSAIYGFDTHTSASDSKGPILPQKMAEFDDALGAFVKEMKLQGIWDDVVLMTISDFGRTMKGNAAAGTDHGWGGNSVIAGGGLNGSRILGTFPARLKAGVGEDIGHGRLLPSTAWEGVYGPMFEWFGLDKEELPTVLPNLPKFVDSTIPLSEMFM
jgi:uncharacterized protein (DUF1501 family)